MKLIEIVPDMITGMAKSSDEDVRIYLSHLSPEKISEIAETVPGNYERLTNQKLSDFRAIELYTIIIGYCRTSLAMITTKFYTSPLIAACQKKLIYYHNKQFEKQNVRNDNSNNPKLSPEGKAFR